MVMSGIMAIMAMTPKASVMGLPPRACEAPRVKARMKVEAMGPEATPPESKAMAVNICGQKRVSPRARV